MKNYNKRNLFFDDLHNQKDLKWLGQNTIILTPMIL